MDKERRQFKCKHFTKFCTGLYEIFGLHGFNFSSFVICFNLVELILFWQKIKISIDSMLKSSMKQNYKLLSKCRWPSTKQVLSTTEWYFENWIALRRKNCQVNTTDTRFNQLIASWIIAHLVGNNWRSAAVLTDTSDNQPSSIHKKWNMRECRHNALAWELNTFDKVP